MLFYKLGIVLYGVYDVYGWECWFFLCIYIMYVFGKVVGNIIDVYEWNDKGVGGK